MNDFNQHHNNQNNNSTNKFDSGSHQDFPQFIKQGEFSLKGKYAIIVNVLSVVLLIGGFVAMFFIFDVLGTEFLVSLIHMAVGLGIGLAVIVLQFVYKLIVLKIAGGGRCKFKIGLMMEVSAEKPISKIAYIISDLFIFIALAGIIVGAVFMWTAAAYLAILFLSITVVLGFPSFIFTFRQPRDSFLDFRDGKINSYKDGGEGGGSE